jgi:hypothetical protein
VREARDRYAVTAPTPEEIAELVRELRRIEAGWTQLRAARALESLSAELQQRDAELAALSEAAMDADLHCWGPAFDNPTVAHEYARRLRNLCQPNRDRTNAAWVLLDKLTKLRAELREKDDKILHFARNGVEALEMVSRKTAQVDQLRAELREAEAARDSRELALRMTHAELETVRTELREALEGNAALRELLETAWRERDEEREVCIRVIIDEMGHDAVSRESMLTRIRARGAKGV